MPWARPNLAVDEDLRDLGACPIQFPSHLVRAEWATLRYLERSGIEYGVFSDHDFAFDGNPCLSKLLIFNTHSEYWSSEMVARLESFLAAGGHALFLSGNNLYRKVSFLEKGIKVYDFKTDSVAVSQLVGAAYDARGYLTYAGYEVQDPSHWLFDGTEVVAGDVFGHDPSSATPAGASGYETDKITEGSRDVSILAVGKNLEGPAFMVLQSKGKGSVLNTASVASAPWVERDPVFSKLVGNYIHHAITKMH